MLHTLFNTFNPASESTAYTIKNLLRKMFLYFAAVTPATRFSVMQHRSADKPAPVARFEEPEQSSPDKMLQQLLNIQSLNLR